MEPPSLTLLFLVVTAVVSFSYSAPVQEKIAVGCNKAKGAVRSSVESTDNNAHLLADLDALSKGVKRSGIDKGCNESPAENVEGTKKQTLSKIKDEKIVNEDDVDKMPIVETGKAAIRSSIVKNETNSQIAPANATAASPGNATAALSSVNKEVATNTTAVNVNANDNSTVPVPGTAAKTFIAKTHGVIDVNANKRSHKPKPRLAKTKNAMKKSKAMAATHKAIDTSIDDGPSMQKGSLSKETENQEKGTAKSTSNLLEPLSSAIKSLDSASKLLGQATASKNTEPASNTEVTDEKATADPAAALTPSNKTSVDASTRSAPSTGSTAKESSGSPAAAAPATKPAATAAADPYAEIAVGPDSPKMPDLKTGSDKAGLPVMKVDPTNGGPEQVSFNKEEPGAMAPKPVAAGSSNRPGPQDVGGILDQLTDKLNKGGVAPENPLPPSESKSVMDQLTDFDHDALETAKGWETTGLKAIEKLKSAEYSHGSMKNELSKELSERLAGGGYGASLGANIDSAEPATMVSNLDAPSQTTYPQQSYSRQQSSQWPEFNSMENLDSEAQREEQSFSQYDEGHEGNYGGNSEPMMPSEQNSYDRQEIPSYLNQGLEREAMDSNQEQGQYYKRNIILRPYYYHYDHHLPYGFRHPYDD